MKIAFVVKCATQFEAPFYAFVAQNDVINQFHIFFLEEPSNWRLDKETGLTINWGIDLFAGYPHSHLKRTGCDERFRAVVENSFDLVIINGYKNELLGLAKQLRSRNIPTALRMDTVALDEPFLKMALRRLVMPAIYKKFDKYMVTGTASKNYLLEIGIEKEKISLFPYCTDNNRFSNSRAAGYRPSACLTMESDCKIVLVVAKFIDRENPEEVIHAFGRLGDQNLCLVIVGDGALRSKLEKQLSNYPEAKILFTGYIPYTGLPQYYRRAVLFIHPAKNEPWGVSVQEAIGCGCRIICSNKVGAGYDLIEEGKNGFVYSAGNVSELVCCIKKCLQIPDELVRQTNKRVLEKWNYTIAWQQIVQTAAESSEKLSPGLNVTYV